MTLLRRVAWGREGQAGRVAGELLVAEPLDVMPARRDQGVDQLVAVFGEVTHRVAGVAQRTQQDDG